MVFQSISARWSECCSVMRSLGYIDRGCGGKKSVDSAVLECPGDDRRSLSISGQRIDAGSRICRPARLMTGGCANLTVRCNTALYGRQMATRSSRVDNENETRPADEALTAALFRALGEPARLALLWHLFTGEHSVRELTDHLGLAQSTVSVHLASLRDCGLVTVRNRGRSSIYAIRDPGGHATLIGSAEDLLKGGVAQDAGDPHTTQVATAHITVDNECLSDRHTVRSLDPLGECPTTSSPISVAHSNFQIEPAQHRTHERLGRA